MGNSILLRGRRWIEAKLKNYVNTLLPSEGVQCAPFFEEFVQFYRGKGNIVYGSSGVCSSEGKQAA